MIRGYLGGRAGRRRPFVVATLTIPSIAVAGLVHLLIDTGADSSVLAPRDARTSGIDPRRLPLGPASVGIGGATPTAVAPATLQLGSHALTLDLRILAPETDTQRRALSTIPSLLGRDVLAHFALFFEERTERVLLLDPAEAQCLALP